MGIGSRQLPNDNRDIEASELSQYVHVHWILKPVFFAFPGLTPRTAPLPTPQYTIAGTLSGYRKERGFTGKPEDTGSTCKGRAAASPRSHHDRAAHLVNASQPAIAATCASSNNGPTRLSCGARRLVSSMPLWRRLERQLRER